MTKSQIIELTAGAMRLRLAPQIGGAIVDWLDEDLPILRPSSEADLASGESNRLGSYPLVPYSNRINRGCFTWQGSGHRLALNFIGRPHAMHGIGWQRPWTVEAASTDTARLSLLHRPTVDGAQTWPFAFRAEQHFRLDHSGLAIGMRLENCDRQPWPAGLGQHPYFPRTADVELQFAAASVWHNGEDYLPSGRTALPPAWDYGGMRPLGQPGLDNCFAGWQGVARIVWPARRRSLEIRADRQFGHCIVFTPADRDFFAFEPVSHMNDAINRIADTADHGLIELAPGATLEAAMEFRLVRS